ncbi:MAG: phosphotransferase, partial [Chloroflexota bacterium]|nr:phosphotransferase [Chloroflexota bacterium]
HKRRSLQSINAELDLLWHLARGGVKVSCAIPAPDGERLLRIDAPEGVRYAALFTFAEGKTPPQDTGPSIWRSCGASLAGIHRVADSLKGPLARLPFDRTTLLDWPMQHLERVLAERPHHLVLLRKAAEIVGPRLDSLSKAAPAYGICHCDACPPNVHVTEGGEITFIDFELCGVSWRAYDLAVFVEYLGAKATEAFREGYESVRPLADWEWQTIPIFQTLRNIWVLGTQASYINQWGLDRYTDERLAPMMAKIKSSIGSIEGQSTG